VPLHAIAATDACPRRRKESMEQPLTWLFGSTKKVGKMEKTPSLYRQKGV
jgi:hypothetical protein